MARKSRKGNRAPEQAETKSAPATWSVGVYARLSAENNGREDQSSIETQVDIITAAVAKMPDARIAGIWRDNGRTGTNMDRAGFQSLVSAVEAGDVNCIAVKDLSRFARNGAEAERYLREVLPALGCRLVAVADGFDSAAADANDVLAARLKNIVNEVHSRDLSAKERAAKLARMREGTLRISTPPYGYVRDPGNPARLAIHPERAEVVRRIFREALSGKRSTTIAAALTAEGVETPGMAQRTRAPHGGKITRWDDVEVVKILDNPVYTGDLIWNQQDGSVFLPKRVARPADEHVIIADAHEAIVSREDFARMRSMREEAKMLRAAQVAGTSAIRERMPDYFRGIVFCGSCGKRMAFDRNIHHGTTMGASYECYGYIRDHECSPHRIAEPLLRMAVGDAIRAQVAIHTSLPDLARAVKSDPVFEERVSGLARDLADARHEIARIDDKRRHMYAQMCAGKLTRDQWRDAKRMSDALAREAVARADALEGRIAGIEGALRCDPGFAGVLGSAASLALTPELVHALVARVDVFGKRRVRVTMRFEDYFDKLKRLEGALR